MRSRTLASLAALVAAGALLACKGELPTSAASTPLKASAGAPVSTGALRFQGTTSLCDVTPLNEDVTLTGATWGPDGLGNTSKSTGSARFILTNPDNGKAIVWLSAGPSTEEVLQDNGDGSYVVQQIFGGLGPMLKTLQGAILLRNAGYAVIVGVAFPADPSQNYITSAQIYGPHPAMPLSPDFCAVVDGALQ